MSNHIFSEDEVRKLIKRTAELEAERSVSGKDSGKNGLTLDELKDVASEAGLDPQLIEQIASEMVATSPVLKERVRVNREEIVSEIWIDLQSDNEMMDLLVMELNHIYGTTDDLNWWDNVWGTYQGKAKVTKTSHTREWKTEAGMYSTRALMQQRGDRFRIRVSKRQTMGIEWDSVMNSLFLMVPVAVVLCVIGGVTSSSVFGTGGPGVLSGFLFSLFSYPLIRHFTKRSIEKHKTEVANTVRQLSNLVLHSSNQKKRKSTGKKKNRSASDIEISDDPKSTESQPGKLRNNLRE